MALFPGHEHWRFGGPFRKMTLASRMQHKIYWRRSKRPLFWSLKTWLARWARLPSVLYYDTFWYPFLARRALGDALESEWGHLFRNWVQLEPDADGFPEVGDAPAEYRRAGWPAFPQSIRLLGTCPREAADRRAHRRSRAAAQSESVG